MKVFKYVFISLQGKNIWQAEIDAAAEMIDFLRFNIQFARVSITLYSVRLSNGRETTHISE